MPLSDMSMLWTLFLSFCFLAAMGWAASAMMCCLVTRQSYKASCYGLESLKLWATIYPSPLKQLILGILSHQQKADPHLCEHQGPPQCTLILEVSLWKQQHLLQWIFLPGMFSVQAEILDGRLSEFLSQGAGLLTASQPPLSLIAINTFEGLKPFTQVTLPNQGHWFISCSAKCGWGSLGTNRAKFLCHLKASLLFSY